MLARKVKYTDFDGNEAVDTFYFNLSQTELVEYNVDSSYPSGFTKFIQKIIESSNHDELIREFKKLILASYGVKSEDGKRFIKSDELREEFVQTAAYDALFIELATNETAAAEFIKGVIPTNLRGDQDKPTFPPPPATES